VEQDGGRNDWNDRPAESKPLASCRDRRGNAACSLQPEYGSPRQHDRVDAFDKAARIEQIGLAAARRAAMRRDAGDGRRIRHDHGHPGARSLVFGVPDTDACDVSDKVAPRRPALVHATVLPSRRRVDAAITLAAATISSMTMNSSGWCASSSRPGP